jgi:hypothetical protein
MNYENINLLNKISYLHPPPKTSVLNNFYNINKVNTIETNNNNYKFVKYKNSKNNNFIKMKNENKYAYSMIWKGIHYVSNFLNSLPNEIQETENSYILFIKCISELIPNEEYSRHMKEFINKYPLNNLKTTNDKFKWSYKLHSYVNFMKFIKNIKQYILNFSKKDVETILNNFCISLEMDKKQIDICTSYINNKIKSLVFTNETNDELEDYIFVENISYEKALSIYTISDTNIITKNDWGPAIWIMIHFFAANIKKEKLVYYNEFIKTLTYVIPCEECRKHLRQNLKMIPLNINNNTTNLTLFEWSCKIHNLVNSQLKKPTYNFCNSLFYKYLDNYNSTYEYI